MAQTAQDAFLTAKFKIDALLNRIQAESEDHFSVSPDEIQWGHVATLEDVVTRLTRITDAMFHEGEHAPDARS